MQRTRSKTITLKKAKEQPSTDVSTPPQKRTVARICCLRLQSKWTIRNQFMSSILILNFIFLILIITSILGTLIGLGVLLLGLTKEQIKTSQLENFKQWSIEKSEAISNKLGYYYGVNDYFGSLLQEMNLQDSFLFTYQVYPLIQPNSSNFSGLPQFGYTQATTSTDQIAAYLSNSQALNYFAQSLLTPFEDIPINRMYATYMDGNNNSILTIGYPNTSTFALPSLSSTSDNNSLWYSDALRTSTQHSWNVAYDGDLPLFQLSRRFNKADGSPLLVTCVELNLTLTQMHVLDQLNANTGNFTPTLLLDVDGMIVLASSDLGYSFLDSQPRVGQNGSFTIDEWDQVKSIAELQEGDVITWDDSNGEIYHISANKLDLPFDPSIDTIYVVHYYPDSALLSTVDTLSNDIYDQTFKNVMICGLTVLGSFLIMAILSCLVARRFLEPLKLISDFAFTKTAQTINKYDGEKEIKPLKLTDGSDEIGELMDVFKKLSQGFSYSTTTVKEKESTKKVDKVTDAYPKNYFRGKTMPWREELKKLQPKLSKQAQKESTRDKYDGFISRLTRSNS